MSKVKAAVAWNSSCGGCDESIVDLEKKILDVAARVEFVLWPCAMDFKYKDIEALADGEITVSLINGGIQNTHQEYVAQLLRRKSKLIVAFGSCAATGGVPALANLTTMHEIFETSYIKAPTVDNPQKVYPQPVTELDGREFSLPRMFESLLKLDDVIPVDYYLPGCPPTPAMIADALQAILSGNLPPTGSVLASDKALCASCDRNATKPEHINLKEIKRIHQIEADPNTCFLVQGVICMGPATRDGCDYPCIKANMPCTGCLGPVSGADQGAKMISALAGILDGETDEQAEQVLKDLHDPAGTFYRYCLAASLLGRRRKGD